MLMPNIAVNIYYIICYLNTNFNVIEKNKYENIDDIEKGYL